jgi:hypothetical protein
VGVAGFRFGANLVITGAGAGVSRSGSGDTTEASGIKHLDRNEEAV